MPAAKEDAVAPLPATKIHRAAPGVNLLEPLSRKGTGPGIILVVHETGLVSDTEARIENGVPSPIMKWAEEGYAVVELLPEVWADASSLPIHLAIAALLRCETCDDSISGRFGIVCYDFSVWPQLSSHIQETHQHLAGAVLYAPTTSLPSTDTNPSKLPLAIHLAGKSSSPLPRSETLTIWDYPSTASEIFARPFHKSFDYAAEAVSHSRSLAFLKKRMNGPYFDLEAIWDEHTYFEFGERDVDKTMGTMVQEPYVNHVPTLTGGIGRTALSAFYRDHFIFSNPPDTELELISRTVGIDRVVDEFIFKFTHSTTVDWLFPGVPPTNLPVQIPMMAVVNIRGDRLYHEHISWDQATALAQIGLLPTYNEATENGSKAAPTTNGHAIPRLPIAGAETAAKMRDKNSVGSNGMLM